jgi:hypothetical protein
MNRFRETRMEWLQAGDPQPKVIWVSDDLLLTMATACRGEGRSDAEPETSEPGDTPSQSRRRLGL